MRTLTPLKPFAIAVVCSAAVGLALPACGGSEGGTAQVGQPVSATGMPAYIYGVTDDESGLSPSQIAAGLASFGTRMGIRIVADGSGWSASADAARTAAYEPYAGTMMQLYDSSDITSKTSLTTVTSVTNAYLAASPQPDVYEIGNEVNGTPGGGWLTGCPSDSTSFTATTPCVGLYYRMWKLVHAAGHKTALTFYYEPSPGAGYDMVGWAADLATSFPDMAASLDYIFVSYYEVDNNNVRPTQAQWTTLFSSLHDDFPNAKLGFGEVGLSNPVTSSTLTQAESIMDYYYGLQPSVPNWVGGDFWWYWAEDQKSMSSTLSSIVASGSPDGGTSDGGTSDGGTSDGGTSDGGTSDGGSHVNIAPSGTGYRWYDNTSSTGTSKQTAASWVNDGVYATNWVGNKGSNNDSSWEGIGVTWSSPQTVSSVTFQNGANTNGAYNCFYDVAGTMSLQQTTDGSTWTTVSGCAPSPSYPYSVSACSASGTNYTFNCSLSNVVGVRVFGKVGVTTSWDVTANELTVTN